VSVRPNPPTVFGSSSSCERAKQGAWGILESLVIDHLYNEWMTERWLQSWDIKGCTTFQTTGACGRFRATEEEPDESSSHGPIHTPAATCGLVCAESRELGTFASTGWSLRRTSAPAQKAWRDVTLTTIRRTITFRIWSGTRPVPTHLTLYATVATATPTKRTVSMATNSRRKTPATAAGVVG